VSEIAIDKHGGKKIGRNIDIGRNTDRQGQTYTDNGKQRQTDAQIPRSDDKY